ncbi:MAG: hypothetical protein ACW98F_17510 [Candidatus Hodarchaeales archaeon]|jgi:hypothetical protein
MKISCDAKCERCYHEKGRRQDLDENDLVFFCPSCKRIFLCEIGLARVDKNYSCPFDNTIVVREEVDKSIIQKKSLPVRNVKATSSEEMYHSLIGDKEEKKKKKRFWKRSGSSESLTAYHHSKISELNDIDNLKIDLLIEIAKWREVKNIENLKKISKKLEFLDRLGREKEELIDHIYAVLLKLEDAPKALELRFAVFVATVIANPSQILITSHNNPCDMTVVDDKGLETWVFFTNDNIDLHNLEDFTKRALNIDLKKYPKIKDIYFVARKFSYVASGMMKKFQGAFTGIETLESDGTLNVSRSIPLSVWQPIDGKITFQNVTH